MQDRIFYSIGFGFIFGIFLSSFFILNLYLLILLFVLFLILISVFKYLVINKWGMITSFFFLALFTGFLYFSFFENRIIYDQNNLLNKEVKLSGEIVSDIEDKDLYKRFEFLTFDKHSKILVKTESKIDLKYGDVLNLEGRLLAPSNFLTENGKEFDYINYLKKDGILYTLEAKKLEIIDRGKGNLIKSLLFNIKNTFVAKINTLIFPYESTLLGGLILGEKSSFPNSLREDFIKTGTIHIVALSGYNVTIISEWFIKLLYFLPTVLAFYGGILVIILFVIMTGVEATAVRAGIMAILVLIARNLGRPYDIVRALIVTVVFMLLFNPYLLYYDVSFQLSFISTIAVIFFTPRIEKYFQFVTNKFNLRDIVTVTFSAYVFVLPFVLYKMGNLSLVALPTNILVLPFIPITMLLGFLSGVLAFFSFYLALPFSYITHLFLYYELNIIKFFASIPFSSFVILDFPIILTILIYLYFIYFLFRRGIKVFFTEDFT